MLQLQIRFLLDVSWRLEESREWILWMFSLQRESQHSERVGSCSSELMIIFLSEQPDENLLFIKAREALKKYLHYYERWENHSKSLQLEQQTLDRLKGRINEKVMKGLNSTWIDWQYLFVAASLLAKCRYTLQYTYPYAYYMEASSRKDLFEYQQASCGKRKWSSWNWPSISLF